MSGMGITSTELNCSYFTSISHDFTLRLVRLSPANGAEILADLLPLLFHVPHSKPKALKETAADCWLAQSKQKKCAQFTWKTLSAPAFRRPFRQGQALDRLKRSSASRISRWGPRPLPGPAHFQPIRRSGVSVSAGSLCLCERLMV